MSAQAALQVVDHPDTAASILQPIRLRILDRLREPASATAVARELELPRQKVNYHVRELEKTGLVRHVESRKRGNCVERLVQASARRYVVAPRLLEALEADPDELRDQYSAAYLLATAARTLREVAEMREAARAAGKKLPTLTIETEIRIASPAAQQAFAGELADAVGRLVEKYHDENAESGRSFRIVTTGHPASSTDAAPPVPPASAPTTPEPREEPSP